MEQKSLSPQPELDFENDTVTKWVIQQEDLPVVNDGEIINEPEDVEENAFPDIQTVTPVGFPVSFFYNGTIYSAQVKKGWNTGPEYEVTSVIPAIEHLPEAFVVTVPSKEVFDFPVNETYYPRAFGHAVIEAIRSECRARNISLFD